MALIFIAGVGLFLVGCMRESNGTFIINEAPLPEGWPTLTPVGAVEVKAYPVTRAAVVEAPAGDAAMNPMFNQLFNHIKTNDIPMTAPVDMGYQPIDADADATPAMTSMAFLYRDPQVGQLDDDGKVIVRDLPAQTFASLGVRGDYTDARFADALAQLEAWLADHPQYTAAGPPRTLGYNSPFVPAFFRYGEVQIPVETVDTTD